MRNRFEQQLTIGILPIEKAEIPLKIRTPLMELLASLLKIYQTPEYSSQIFNVLEKHLQLGKKKTGRKGMNLWQIFVLGQVRLCENLSYIHLHSYANTHIPLRELLGVGADNGGFTRIEFEYQNIYDNISVLRDELLLELNEIIITFGHNEVFKKKEKEALRLKSDSFVVESNVHFPTDYNLLWDSIRKCLTSLNHLTDKYKDIKGWRKLSNWKREIKGLMRELGRASSSGGKNKAPRVKNSATKYLNKAKAFLSKLKKTLPELPIDDLYDLSEILIIEHFIEMIIKHIDLVERRILKGEKIPHSEKLFSVFETYTEWITKGKLRPNVELGKKLNITTDQYNLIIDYQIMNNEQDRDIVLEIADRVLNKYKVDVWSFEVETVVMPKLGKRNKEEQEEEQSRKFKKNKNIHSSVESNINELEHRGLDRCPDRGEHHYKSYIAMGICAYNLKKIGKKILDDQTELLKQRKKKPKQAA